MATLICIGSRAIRIGWKVLLMSGIIIVVTIVVVLIFVSSRDRISMSIYLFQILTGPSSSSFLLFSSSLASLSQLSEQAS